MGGVGEMLTAARAAGLTLETETDADGVTHLVVLGPETAEALALALLAHKAEVLAWLAAEDAGVAWRADAMRAQVPAHGPIGFLHARDLPTGDVPPGACPSCGEEMEAGQLYACRSCVAAKRIVLTERRDHDAHAA